MAAGGDDTITIFGNREKRYDFFNSACIRRVVFTSGKVKSYVAEINNSLRHGLQPTLFRAEDAATPHPVTTTQDGKVFDARGEDVSESDLSETTSLYTWKASHYYTHDFNYLAFSAEFEAMEYNLFDWFPKAACEHFFAESTCHYYFANVSDGLLMRDNKPIGLENRTDPGRYNALERRGDDEFGLVPIDDASTARNRKMALYVKHACMTIDGVDFATHQDCAVIFAASFYVNKSRPGVKQMLVSNASNERGIYVHEDKCYWVGSKHFDDVGLDIAIEAWNFVFLLLDQRGTGLIQVNDTVQRFETKPVRTARDNTVLLFASPYSTKLNFRGRIGEMVIFNKDYLPSSGVPKRLREQLYTHFMDRVAVDDAKGEEE